MLWAEGASSERSVCIWACFRLMPPRQRYLVATLPFRNFAIAKRCAVFAQFDILNRFLNWVYIRRVVARARLGRLGCFDVRGGSSAELAHLVPDYCSRKGAEPGTGQRRMRRLRRESVFRVLSPLITHVLNARRK